ncbi:hypothetical protein ES705_45530 [subsurface metagenome]
MDKHGIITFCKKLPALGLFGLELDNSFSPHLFHVLTKRKISACQYHQNNQFYDFLAHGFSLSYSFLALKAILYLFYRPESQKSLRHFLNFEKQRAGGLPGSVAFHCKI